MAGFISRKKSSLAEAREIQKAAAVMDLSVSECSRDTVMARFKSLVRETHPDLSEQSELEHTIEDITAAKNILIKSMEKYDA